MCGNNACVNGKMVYINGKPVGLNRLYDVFEHLYESGKRPGDTAGAEILSEIAHYTYVPRGLEKPYEEALLREYQTYYNEKEVR
jgi:hypothetical protein